MTLLSFWMYNIVQGTISSTFVCRQPSGLAKMSSNIRKKYWMHAMRTSISVWQSRKLCRRKATRLSSRCRRWNTQCPSLTRTPRMLPDRYTLTILTLSQSPHHCNVVWQQGPDWPLTPLAMFLKEKPLTSAHNSLGLGSLPIAARLRWSICRVTMYGNIWHVKWKLPPLYDKRADFCHAVN